MPKLEMTMPDGMAFHGTAILDGVDVSADAFKVEIGVTETLLFLYERPTRILEDGNSLAYRTVSITELTVNK